MHRLHTGILAWLMGVWLAPALAGGPLEYQLKIEGMACAFCAYNSVRQLARIPGVQPRSVHIDLATGTARLQSDRPLAQDAVARGLEHAGFRLVAMRHTKAVDTAPPLPTSALLQVQTDRAALDDGQAGAVLEALGDAVAQHGGRLRVQAPAAAEMTLMRALLMGRSAAIPVQFEPRAAGAAVVVEWLAAGRP